MKKTLLLSLTMLLCTLGFAQQLKVQNNTSALMVAPVDNAAVISESVPPSENVFMRDGAELGFTTYDLQSNSSMPSRIVNHEGNILTTWTYGNSEPAAGVPERGTAFRMRNTAGEWSPEPMERIEPVRTGWPSTNVTTGGTVTNLAHSVDYDLVFSTRSLDDPTWSTNFIPTNTPSGALWPRSASGGADGNSVHAIAVTTPVTFGGVEYEGLDGHLLYWRSQDEGATWDVQDFIIPGCDSSRYSRLTNDAYSISAFGNTVAVAVFTDWNDLNVFISKDNGDTWSRRIVNDFPLKKYVIDEGYTYDQLTEDPNAPDSLAIFSNDGTGHVFVDGSEQVHLVFSAMYYMDADLVDGTFQFFPFTDGLYYWNELMDDNMAVLAGQAEDMDGDDSLSISEASGYFEALSSQGSLGMDDDGNLYLSYCSVNELYLNEAGQAPMNVFLTTSSDLGATWSERRNLSLECEETKDFAEAGFEFYYAKMASKVDDRIHIIVQSDFEPGTAVQDTELPVEPSPNFMFYIGAPVDPTNNDDLEEINSLNVFPNPAQDVLNVEMDVVDAEQATITLSNTLGQVVYSSNILNVSNVKFQSIDTQAFDSGTYFLQIATDKEQLTQTVILQK